MKTKLYLIIVLVVVALSVNAQSKDEKSFKIGAGAMIGLPTGDVANFTTMAYGVDLLGEYSVAPSFALTASLGYLDFAAKSGMSGLKMGFVPVLVGAKYYFTEKVYGSGQIGVSFSTQSGGGNAFTFAPGIGCKVTGNFDLMLKYQSASKEGSAISFLGVRAGLTF
ncbi:MAG: outer membrane beta-barrel protein [Mariniphaga sp.]